MPSTFTTNTGIEKIADGEQTSLWGQTTNLNFDIIDRALNGSVDVVLSGTTHTLTTNDGILSDGQFAVLVFTGSLSDPNTVTVAPDTGQKLYWVRNTTSQNVILSQGSGSNVTIPPGVAKAVYCDGAGATAAVVDLTSVFVGDVTGDVTGNVTGDVTGNLTGNVTGDVTGNLTGNVTGDVTGNADTATALATARLIGGVSFDGTANIILPGVNATGNQDTTGNAATATLADDATTLATARTLTVGDTGKTFDGSADVSWTLGEIGVTLATQAEAEAGADNTKFMTPLRTAEAIAELSPSTSALTETQVTDGTSVVFGTVSGERLSQAVAEFGPISAASVAVGSVGSYAFLANLSTTASNPGNTVAGSSLRFFGIRDTQVNNAGNIQGTTPSGVWMCMGTGNNNAGSGTSGTLWLRVS